MKVDQKLSKQELKERLYRRRYLVPNAVTLGNMFCGFLITIYAASGRFEKAVIAIAVAILLDGLDGRVARKLNATSKFGLELDSFADLVSFGVAPALLMYHWCFKTTADEFGVFVCFLFALCSASRLARFNITDTNLKGFDGLPTPGAAAMVMAVVNLDPTPVASQSFVVFCSVLMMLLSYLMVSKHPFFSIKTMKITGIRKSAQIALGAIIALIWYSPKIGFFVMATSYCLAGPFAELKKQWPKRRKSQSETVPQQKS